jgi:hypothetical protein
MGETMCGRAAALIDGLPAPQAVRERLGQALREAQLLRQLLRLSERASQERERACHGSLPWQGRPRG